MSVAIILCGGISERMGLPNGLPKTLIKIDAKCVLQFVLNQARQLNVHFIVLVTNAKNYGAIKNYILSAENIQLNTAPEIKICIADHAHLGNGMTMYEGIKHYWEDFYVLMADHLIEKKGIHYFCKAVQTVQHTCPLLACDLDIKTIFDINDATKVSLNNNKITAIDKNLTNYNAIDMGLFYFPRFYIKIIQNAIENGVYSLTEIVKFILNQGDFYGVPLKNIKWQDVDTPAMLLQATLQFVGS